MPDSQRILVAAYWPTGGIRTYLRYVHQHEELGVQAYRLVTPAAEHLDVVLESFASGDVRHLSSERSLRAFGYTVAKVVSDWRPELIHSHGFTTASVLAPLAMTYRVPHLITSHDVLFQTQFQGVKGQLKRLGVAACLRSADHVMAVGTDALRNLRGFYPFLARNGRSSAVRNGIDTRLFLGEQRRDLRGELDLGAEATLLGFFGRFMAQKGFMYLVDAVERLSRDGSDVHVACFGWGGFIREEQQMLRHRGLLDRFHFQSHTDDMVAALRGVDAVVMPSRWEACPLLPMEALVSGAPAITSDCIGMREVVRDTPALVFSSGDVDGLVDCINRVGSDPDAWKRTAEAFREEAAARFDSCSAASGLSDLYRRVTGGAR